MNKENQEFANYVSSLNDTEAIYDSDYDNPTFDSNLTDPTIDAILDSESTKSTIDPVCDSESAAVCNFNECSLDSCDLDDGELTCGDDFADNGETIQGGLCQDLIEYFSDKPYLD